MITAADYSDWAHFAGLYLRNLSNADRYRSYQNQISRPGVVTRIVFDFLQHNSGGIDLSKWRTYDVYELGADAQWRVEQTALALEAIGATRTAVKVRTAQDNSLGAMFFNRLNSGESLPSLMEAMRNQNLPDMVNQMRESIARATGIPTERKPVPLDAEVETRERIEYLLQQYVEANQSKLGADYDKHGDPRSVPGFDPQVREKELEALRHAEFDRETQKEQAVELSTLLDNFQQSLIKNPKAAATKHRDARRKILDGYKKYSRRNPDELLPEMKKWLAKAGRAIEAHAEIFRPQPIEDQTLLARLTELGEYQVDLERSSVTISWDDPKGFVSDWGDFSLTIAFPPKNKKILRSLLDQIDRTRANWERHRDELRQEVLDSFWMCFEPGRAIWFDDYPRDESGRPTEAGILDHCRYGSIRIDKTEDGDLMGDGISVFFGIDWDDEHGLQLGIVDEFEDDESDE